MKCIIYSTTATSKLLFTLGRKIMQHAIEPELKVHVLSYNSYSNSIWRRRKQMLCEYHSDTTTVHLHGPRAAGIQPAAATHGSVTRSTSTKWAGFLHHSCFFHVLKRLSACAKRSVNTKRCHEYVAVGSFVLIMDGNVHPLHSWCWSLTDTLLLDDSGGNLTVSRNVRR